MNINKVWDNSKITLWQIDGDQKWFRNVVDLQIHLKNRREIPEACLYFRSPPPLPAIPAFQYSALDSQRRSPPQGHASRRPVRR